MRLAFWLGLLVAAVPSVAQAEWLQASSEHFVVYANDSERDLRKFSDQLERYHSAMAYLSSAVLPTPSPSNRVTVYVVSGQAEVRRLYGEDSKYVRAFYVPRAGGSLAIVPRVTTGGMTLDESMIMLLHEYAHHFMISASPFPMPRWYSEGGAEFFASAAFRSNGGIDVGRAAMHRAAELLIPGFARDVRAADLLDPLAAGSSAKSGYDAFYGKSWLLFHYLTFDQARAGQMARYLGFMAKGKTSREAGLAAFGDFDQLERDLDRYLGLPRMKMLTLPAAELTIAPIEIRRLSPGEAAMMPLRIRSRRGVDEEQAKALLVAARAVAARFPDDPAVLSALAEAEHDAGNDKESVAAADAALAKDPSQVNAYIQKGLSLFRIAADAPDPAAAYSKARAPFIALNHRENDHPLPLIYNYRSFVEQQKPPTELALRGLAKAVQLAPFDLGLRMTLAVEQIQHGQVAQARISLAPVAYNPHGGSLAQAAQRVLAHLDADPDCDGRDLASVTGGANDDMAE